MKNWKKGIILAASLAMAAGIMAGCGVNALSGHLAYFFG